MLLAQSIIVVVRFLLEQVHLERRFHGILVLLSDHRAIAVRSIVVALLAHGYFRLDLEMQLTELMLLCLQAVFSAASGSPCLVTFGAALESYCLLADLTCEFILPLR